MPEGAVRIHSGTSVGPRLRWVAPQVDGIGHAFPAGPTDPAACGALPIDARLAYLVRTHCTECLIVQGAEQVRLAPPTESELRLLDGNR